MSNKKLQPVRGTHDLIGGDMMLHRHIIDNARQVAALYGCSEVATPMFEFTDIFHRTLGQSSDVVNKETYSFDDRGGESLTLRPELTAGIVRAFISGGYTQQLPFKAFYAGAAFRYERPQKGRQRQFHQVGVEIIGADSPAFDIETIASAKQLLDVLGLSEHAVLELNSLGCSESRATYRSKLVEYLSDYESELSDDSKTRLKVNPLRILDSKNEGDKKIITNAPTLFESFTTEASDWFKTVKSGLNNLDIKYEISPRLVRGLDYYTHTVFEFTTSLLGSQNTILAGGRYNDLVEQMGGPKDIAGIGWAAGIERLSLLISGVGADSKIAPPTKPIAIIPFGEAEQYVALKILQNLRQNGIYGEILIKGNMSKRFKKAENIGASLMLLLGDDEVAAGVVTLKNLNTGEQKQVAIDGIITTVINRLDRLI